MMKRLLLVIFLLSAMTASAQDNAKKEADNLRKKAEAGDYRARCDYAFAIFNGRSVKADQAAGMQTLTDLVSEFPDSSHAAYLLGRCYLLADQPDTSQALALLNRAADQNDRMALNSLGYAYLYGIMEGIDYRMAQHYFQRALATQSGTAALFLGHMSYYGLGCNFDKAQGVDYYKQGYRLKNFGAADVLGDLYLEGVPNVLEQDPQKAAECYRNAIKWGNEFSCYKMGRLYEMSGDTAQAEQYYRRAAAANKLQAYFQAGNMYYSTGNYAKSTAWFAEGSKAGSVDCARILGYCYETGTGVKQDYAKAVEQFEKCHDEYAFEHLGFIYIDHKLGKADNYDKGIDYLAHAAEMGSVKAAAALGDIYASGNDHVAQDYQMSARYYQMLAEKSIPEGFLAMGRYYEKGLGVAKDTARAYRYYVRAAEAGSNAAFCVLGDLHRSGRLVGTVDQKTAFGFYSDAALNQFPHGLYLVGRSHLEGCGVEIDTLAALPFLQQAADLNDAAAADQLGMLYQYGAISIVPNRKRAAECFARAAELGNPHACYVVGRALIRENHPDQGIEFLRKGTELGSDSAMVLYADCLMSGVGVKADPAQAFSLYERAAVDHKSGCAYYKMGLARRQGIGCDADLPLAVRYFRNGAELNDASAMYELASCLASGWDGKPDEAAAVSWIRKSAALNNTDALLLLGTLYRDGSSQYVEHDEAQAFRLFQYVADTAKSVEGMVQLAYCYERGHGCLINTPRAVELYTKAAEAGSAKAMYMLAHHYGDDLYVETGDDDGEHHVAADHEKYFEWMKKSADAGFAPAMAYLGWMYESGIGVEKDLKMAVKYYKMAADLGDADSASALLRLK